MTEKPKTAALLVVEAAEIPGMEEIHGKFAFRRPTIKDEITIGLELAKMTENISFSNAYYATLANILATFRVVCTEKPKNFDFESFPDVEALVEIYNRYFTWLDSFRKKLSAREEPAGEGRGQ